MLSQWLAPYRQVRKRRHQVLFPLIAPSLVRGMETMGHCRCKFLRLRRYPGTCDQCHFYLLSTRVLDPTGHRPRSCPTSTRSSMRWGVHIRAGRLQGESSCILDRKPSAIPAAKASTILLEAPAPLLALFLMI